VPLAGFSGAFVWLKAQTFAEPRLPSLTRGPSSPG
jgi:hypothetical protein